ncbi:hypothetical protein JWK44_08905 [Staphylococcus saprophyticus]|uniref:hypothetical protein n=1 Tax=Staphylococcus saprophyticus TaxID=29385 RepID=UPI001A8C9B25|nr:hypothetical protein [Staphylococcus saprophyticus]MBO0382635.1 hypothetical protein [Staphylococcus saprophyticus]
MAYEYEKTIKEELEFTDLDNTDDQDKMLKELQEVYRKAKAWEQFKNDYHTEITQAIDNLFKLNNMDIADETIFLLEKILSDLEDE